MLMSRQFRGIIASTLVVLGVSACSSPATSIPSAPAVVVAAPTPSEPQNLHANASTASDGQSISTAPILSANQLYREFKNNPVDAGKKYNDKNVTLEARRGEVVLTTMQPGAAVHISDQHNLIALIAHFPDMNDLSGIDEGDVFAFSCDFTNYKYGTVWLDNCTTT